MVRAAAGCLVLLYVPTYRPWRNPIELVWRHVRREVTPCALFDTMGVLITAAYACFARYTHLPQRVLSIIGAHPTSCMWLYLVYTVRSFLGFVERKERCMTARRWVRPPRLYRSENGGSERHASWFELFFDLVFVIAVAELAHTLHDDLTFAGLVG